MDGVLQVVGLEALLPCQLMIDLILFIFRSTAAFTLMIETAIDDGRYIIEMMAIPATMTAQRSYNDFMTLIPGLLQQSTDDPCFKNMTIQYQEVVRFKPNNTQYIVEYLETMREFREALTESRESGQTYWHRYAVCNRCDCLPILIESVTEWLIKLGPIIMKNWVIDMFDAIFRAAHHQMTDLNAYAEQVSLGFHKILFDYQKCVASNPPIPPNPPQIPS